MAGRTKLLGWLLSQACHGLQRTTKTSDSVQQALQQIDSCAGIGNWRRFLNGSVVESGLSLVFLDDKRSFSTVGRGEGTPGSIPKEEVPGRPDAHAESHGATGASSKSASSTSDSTSEREQVLDDKTRVLKAALAYVSRFGWTQDALVEGSKDVGLSPSIVGAFPRGEAELVEYFMDECKKKLAEEADLKQDELSKLLLRKKISALVRMRLEMQAPYVTKWPQALSIQANPVNVSKSLKQRAELMDEIWLIAGDRSTNTDWYAKRALLGGVYSLSELYMLTDFSPGFRDTWIFAEKRIGDIVDCRKTAQEATHFATAVGIGLSNTFQSWLKRLSQTF